MSQADKDLEFTLDPRTQEIYDNMPEWHTKINRQSLVPLFGEWFTFWGIDPQYPDRIILERKETPKKG